MIEIENIVSRYIETENTDYALLLNGPWGSGKTYYLKNTLFRIISNIEKSPLKKYSPIYISLNGLTNTEDISNQILFSRLGLSQAVSSSFGIIKSLLEFGNSVSQPILNTVTSVFKSFGNTIKKTATKVLDLSSSVLCFDDLERFDNEKLSIKNILGYINTNYLEHNHIKTLFICNESELLEKDTDYKFIKEKVIGRVVNFQQDLKTSILNLIENRYNSKNEYRQFLVRNIELILSIALQNQVSNLRTIGFALDSLETIYKFCDSAETKAHLERLIIFIMLISFEYKDSRLVPADNNDNKDLDEIETRYHIYYGLKEESSKEPTPYNVLFYERYLKGHDIVFTFYKSVYVYLLTGYITKTGIEADIFALNSKGITEWDSAYSKFLEFKELEQDELSAIIRVVLSFAQDGKYKLKEYLSIYSYLRVIIDGDYLQYSFDGFFEQLRSGLIRALENLPEARTSLHDLFIWNEYNKREDSQFNQLVNTIKDYLDRLNNKHSKNQIQEFISSLNEDSNSAFRYLENIGVKHLFARLNIAENINQLLTLSNRGIYKLEAILYSNYLRISNAGDLYFDDIPHLKIIADLIEKSVLSKEFDKMRMARFSELIASMRQSAIHLVKTKKKEEKV